MSNIKALFQSKRVLTALASLAVAAAVTLGMSESQADQMIELIKWAAGFVIAGFSLRDPGQALRSGSE